MAVQDCDTGVSMTPGTPARSAQGPRVPCIIVHGGAGADAREGREELRQGIRAAVLAGFAVLARGGRSLDAVEQAVRAMEDHPRFNAGRGPVLTEAGSVEMDASIMEGHRLDCGAVANVSGIANPITLARRVLESRRHVLLVGDGAAAFAGRSGIPLCAPDDLITDRQRAHHAEWLQKREVAAGGGTVGAVA